MALPCWSVVGGDRLSYSIACASIVAKVVRDSLMMFYHRLFPAYQFDRHKGYGTRAHLDALVRHGACALHRVTFRPIAQVCQASRLDASKPACGAAVAVISDDVAG